MTESSTEAMIRNFDELQSRLPALWRMIGRTDPGGPFEEQNTVLVIPSLTADIKLEAALQQAYEERFLFMLFLLRQPNIRMIYLTSSPVQTSIIDYYLQLLPGIIGASARKRLFLVSPNDSSSRPLTVKILERPRLIAQLRSLIPDMERAHIVPFITTDLEREFAVRMGLPMYAADPRFFAFGTKSGCRRIFAEEGVPHPLGVEDLHSEADLVKALQLMRAQKPTMQKAIVKLNEGVSGYGNAVIDLAELPEPGTIREGAALQERLHSMRFEFYAAQYDWYFEKLSEQGGIVEEMILGQTITSPSAQLRITPLREVEQLSTHDQILGGPSGQSYLGARFPADPAYAAQIMAQAKKIGERFAREGIVGRFAVDFLAVRQDDGSWATHAIEVNLRKGGTTHPFLTLQYLTDGMYYPDEGIFRTKRGHEKYYVATDHLESAGYRMFTTEDLYDLASHHRLHYDHTTQTGVVMHMMSCLGSAGLFGLTAIGNTPSQADALYQHFIHVLNFHLDQAGMQDEAHHLHDDV